jgi:hypothetical protein
MKKTYEMTKNMMENCGKKEGTGDVLSTNSHKMKTMREEDKGLIIMTQCTNNTI